MFIISAFFSHTTYIHLASDWKMEMKTELLTFYSMSFSTASGVQVVFTISVSDDFSYTVMFRGQMMNIQECTALRDVFSTLDSGKHNIHVLMLTCTPFIFQVSKVIHLLTKLTPSSLCLGNADEAFLRLPNIRNGLMKDHSSEYAFHTSIDIVLIFSVMLCL